MNRKEARENAFLLIFESVARPDVDKQEIFDIAVNERELTTDDYVKEVFFGAYQQSAVIDSAVEKHSKGWKIQRISPVSMAIIRLAAYEIMFCNDIPHKVSINEAIELSKKYDDEKSYAFVNGVLNALATEYPEK